MRRSTSRQPQWLTETFSDRPLTACGSSLNKPALTLHKFMGQQTNKIQKRRRRLDYIERKKVKALTSSVRKPLKKKAPAKKKAAAAAPAAPAAE